jgi:hypothetical protein
MSQPVKFGIAFGGFALWLSLVATSYVVNDTGIIHILIDAIL